MANEISVLLHLQVLTHCSLVATYGVIEQRVNTGLANGLSPILYRQSIPTPMLTYCQLYHSNDLGWNFNQNTIIFTQENAFESVC